jgi:hypothetical protein
MAPRNRRKREKAVDVGTGILLAVAGVVMIGLLVGALWWVKKTKVILDEATNCPQAGPRAVHVIIVDRTDPITPLQAERIRQKIKEMREAAPFGKRFDIYTVEGDANRVLAPILIICSPNRPEDANELVENPDTIRHRYEERFVSVFDKTINDLLRISTRDTSPIIESMKASAISSFGPSEQRKLPFRLTMVSDMIQGTPAYSHYRTEPNFAQLSRSPAWQSIQPSLFGAEVNILYLLRDQKRGTQPIQNRGHQAFWEELIAASGGRFVSPPENVFDLLR